jgi:hypothetical protein
MRRHLGRFSHSLALVSLVALSAVPARGAFLTGAVVYSTDAAGAPSSGEYWNTSGFDNRYNLYVAIGPNDPILNPGNGASAGITLPLPVGTYTYDIYGENSPVFDHYGLALYFNGSATPGIAAYVTTGHSGASVVTTADGSVTMEGEPAVSPDSLSFVDTTTTVTLTNFSWTGPAPGGLDRVSAYDSTPSGQPDFLGSFTLTVTSNPIPTGNITPVPEPASLALLGLGSLGTGLIAWRRKAHA